MADDEEKKDEGAKDEPKEQAEQAGAKISILTWIIMAVVIVVMAGSGFVLGRLLAGSSAPKTTDNTQENPQTEAIVPSGSDSGSGDTWYYNEMESVIVNPDVPGATRYVRIGLILEISSELSEDEVATLMVAKKPLLTNWLNLYFKSLTLEEMRTDTDLRRILSQICDAFNEMLFGDAKPQIQKILIREFNIQ